MTNLTDKALVEAGHQGHRMAQEETAKRTLDALNQAFMALHLEVDASIVDDLRRRFMEYEIAQNTLAASRAADECAGLRAELDVAKPKWVSVKERLPLIENHMGVMETDVVLTGAGKSTPRVAYMSAEGKWYSYWGDAAMPRPTHWMPLPAAPKKGA